MLKKNGDYATANGTNKKSASELDYNNFTPEQKKLADRRYRESEIIAVEKIMDPNYDDTIVLTVDLSDITYKIFARLRDEENEKLYAVLLNIEYPFEWNAFHVFEIDSENKEMVLLMDDIPEENEQRTRVLSHFLSLVDEYIASNADELVDKQV